MTAPVTSSSTLAQVEACFDDNAGYRESQDPAAAANFILACRLLLRRYAAEAQKGNRSRLRLDGNLQAIRAELDNAVRWLNTYQGNSGGVVFPSFDGLRGY